MLFARLRDRICTLSTLYGLGPLDIDHRGLGDRASQVKTEAMQLVYTSLERRSSRTGQTHPIGGFTGTVEYAGELAEFVPWLEAGVWTGAGRQTVWGNGQIRVARR